MTFTGITALLTSLDEIESVRSSAHPMQVTGLLGAARPAVAAALAKRHQLLVVTAHPQAAADFASEMRRWLDEPVGQFPAIQALPYERVQVDRSVLAERETVLHGLASGSPRVVVSPIRALLQPVDRPERS